MSRALASSTELFMLLLGNTTNAIGGAPQQADYMTAILPLIGTFVGTIVGGMLSYFTTLALSKRDNHSKMEIKRRDQLYIPICSAIEKLKQVSYGNDAAFFGLVIANNINGPEWKEFRKIIKESTLAASRPYLQKSELVLLVKINKMIDDLYINLEELVNLPEGEFGIYLDDVIKTDVLSALDYSPLSMKIIDLDLYDDIDMLMGVLTGESPDLKVNSFRITLEDNDGNKEEYIEEFIPNNLMLCRNLILPEICIPCPFLSLF